VTERWVIYTDGACRGNPGPGGWGAVLYRRGETNELSGAEPKTTNNRMELTAPVEALNALPDSSHVSVYTDSQYVKNGITLWISNWQRNGWKTSKGKQVRNQDLWQALEQSTQRHVVEWYWVKGHSGDAGNERADELANKAIGQLFT